MDSETARLISYAIVTGGGLVWMVSLWFLARCAKLGKAEGSQPIEPSGWMGENPTSPLSGSCEVEGQPAELAARAASALAKSSGVPLGFVKVTEQTHDRVVFVRTHTMGSGLRRGQIHLQLARPNRTRIVYSLETSGNRWLLWAGGLSQLMGLIALGVSFWIIQKYVVTSPMSNVRWQVLQGLQAAHFLWPPFLFGVIYRKTLRMTRNHFDSLINNLPYHSD